MTTTPEDAPAPQPAIASAASRFVAWTTVAANLAVIVGALIVVPLYLMERDDANALERQQLSAGMFAHKYDEHVMAAYIKVGDAFDSNNRLFEMFAGTQEDGKAAAREKVLAAASLGDIKVVVDYYNDLLVCVEQKICDRRLATGLIGQDIHNFYCKARYVGLPELRDQSGYANYGNRLARFAGTCDPAAP